MEEGIRQTKAQNHIAKDVLTLGEKGLVHWRKGGKHPPFKQSGSEGVPRLHSTKKGGQKVFRRSSVIFLTLGIRGCRE